MAKFLQKQAEIIVKRAFKRKAEQVAEEMSRQITAAANKGYATGRLAASVEVKRKGLFSFIIRPTATSETGFEYANVLEDGRKSITTADHPMRFVGRDGKTVFTYYVEGVAPTHFVEKTVDKFK